LRVKLSYEPAEGEIVHCPSCGHTFDFTEAAKRTASQQATAAETSEPPKSGARHIVLSLLGGCAGLLILCCAGIGALGYMILGPTSFPKADGDYGDLRAHFHTRLIHRGPSPQPAEVLQPPQEVTEITYKSGNLLLKAWVSEPSPNGPARQPAVLYLHNGFGFGLDDWEQSEPFRKAGYVVMMPILRGENGQPGNFTLFYDEVDDVIAAAKRLARLPYVDPARVCVAGHSSGGTLTLLAAMSWGGFYKAASFSGSPDQVTFTRFQPELAPYDPNDREEQRMRSPLAFPASFKCPTRIYYGDLEWIFPSASKKLAGLAQAVGKDIEAIGVPGDHLSAVPAEIRQAINFFGR
jgi:dienelactone hydrolase